MENNKITFAQSMLGGFITAIIASVINGMWNYIAQTGLDIYFPLISVFETTLFSLCGMLVGSSIYYLLVRFTSKWRVIFIVITLLYVLPSSYNLMHMSVVNVGNGIQVPQGFPLLTIPMILISGVLAIWGIPKFSKLITV